ncbi:MAG: hypothetical protein KAJ51_05355, partial [Thermoplasmata archaeon]|nr:hypothetical protein [Thermoplasmata archaeon]
YELPTIWHVAGDNSTNGDGSSWGQAFNILDDALETASYDDEIWVAAKTTGDYVPLRYLGSIPTDPRDVLFYVETPMYGGFAGGSTETARQDRDWVQNETVLSGDCGTPSVSTDNAYHVMIGVKSVIVDGFSIQDGNANHAATPDRFISIDSVEYWIYDNVGGGVFNFGLASTILQNCRIKDNYATIGGGVSVIAMQAKTQLINCILADNTADLGGGIYFDNDYGYSSVFNSTIYSNDAIYGAGIFSVGTADIEGYIYCFPGIINTIFSSNVATDGNAIYSVWDLANGNGAVTQLMHCSFVDIVTDPMGFCLDLGGNIETGINPIFENPSTSDFRLLTSSNCVDAGLNVFGIHTDIANNPRAYDYPGVDNNGGI